MPSIVSDKPAQTTTGFITSSTSSIEAVLSELLLQQGEWCLNQLSLAILLKT